MAEREPVAWLEGMVLMDKRENWDVLDLLAVRVTQAKGVLMVILEVLETKDQQESKG